VVQKEREFSVGGPPGRPVNGGYVDKRQIGLLVSTAFLRGHSFFGIFLPPQKLGSLGELRSEVPELKNQSSTQVPWYPSQWYVPGPMTDVKCPAVTFRVE
jgi:hypothetical protein